MKVRSSCTSGVLRFEILPEDDDRPRVNERVSLARPACRYRLSGDWTLQDVHPDLVALTVYLIVRPFLGPRLKAPRPVSAHFAEQFHTLTGKTIGPVDQALSARTPPADGVPALAFSGGVDSTAALTVMPETTIPIFLSRIGPEGVGALQRWAGRLVRGMHQWQRFGHGPGAIVRALRDRTLTAPELYDQDAARYACEQVAEQRCDVHIVHSDLEHVRSPVGFPTDVVNATPALLLADRLKLDSIAFGTIMESAYRTGHAHFQDYAQRWHYVNLGGLFHAVGLPFNLVVAGVSEVGTCRMIQTAPLGHVAQSCIRGRRSRPYLNCWKASERSWLTERCVVRRLRTRCWMVSSRSGRRKSTCGDSRSSTRTSSPGSPPATAARIR